MIGVMVRDEDVPKLSERQSSENQLTGDAVSSIDDVQLATAGDHLRASRPFPAWPRPAGSAKQDEPRPVGRERLRCEPSRQQARAESGNGRAPVQIHSCELRVPMRSSRD